jgi:flagellar biosynthesis protein FlhB
VALKIRDLAAEAGIPVHSDPPTARALHAGVEIGQEIAPEHYAPVAAAIRFAEAMRAKARARGIRPRSEPR